MANYHFVYKDVEGASTQWDDIQRKLGNLPPKPPAFKPPSFKPTKDEDSKHKDKARHRECDYHRRVRLSALCRDKVLVKRFFHHSPIETRSDRAVPTIDRFSTLPVEIKLNILEHIPFEEAARTSISRTINWSEHPQVILDKLLVDEWGRCILLDAGAWADKVAEILSNHESPMKGWLDRQHGVQGHKPVGNGMEPLDPSECDDGDARISAMGSFLRNASDAVDSHDSLCSEKLQFSSFMSPQVNGLNSLICDKSSDGIPLYYFKKDKQAVTIARPASDSSLQFNTFGFGSSSTPWMDPVNKSFGLANSVPAPKLVSGSFSINNGSEQFHRVVHEAEGRESDQTAYVNSKFQDLGMSSTMKGSPITAVDAPTPNDVTGLPSFTRGSSIPDSGWTPEFCCCQQWWNQR